MKKVKSVLLKVKVKGQGIVNYDEGKQKYIYEKDHPLRRYDDNVNYAKKYFYYDEEGKLQYKIKISSECLRNSIFHEDVISQNPGIVLNPLFFLNFIGSEYSILRGYAFLNKEASYKRKSPITVTDALQTSDGCSFLELCTKSGNKDTGESKDDGSTSMFNVEKIGDIEYEFNSIIDLRELQFVSTDDLFDRLSFSPDNFDKYKEFLTRRIKTFNSNLGYYSLINSIDQTPEYGFKFSDEDINYLVKWYFKRVCGININRRGSYAHTFEVQYKLVEDVFKDKMEDSNGWTTINSESDIDNLNINVQDYYVEVDTDFAENARKEMKANKVKVGEEKDLKKKEEKAKKKEGKKKVTTVEEEPNLNENGN